MQSVRATVLRALLALGLSFTLWAFISFSQNPEEQVLFEDVALQVVGLEPGLVIVDTNGVPNPALPAVDLTLLTDRNQRETLRPIDIQAIIDISGLGPGEHVVPVNVQPTRNTISFSVTSDGVQPGAISVRIEPLVTASVPIDLDVIGNLPFSFERGEPEISFAGDPIAEVEISGPQSRVERVTAAATTANIEQLRAIYVAPLSLQPIDDAGQVVEGVRVTPGTVTVRIPIVSVVGLKLVPVEAAVIGLPAVGYEIRGIRVDPPLITLTGSSGPLDAVQLLQTEPIDVSGAAGTLTSQAEIIFPNGTSPQAGEPRRVAVTVQIALVERPFQVELPVRVELLGLASGLNVFLDPVVVNLTLTGTSNALDGLNDTAPRATVNVNGLGAGTYQIPVQVILPADVTLTGDPPIVTVTLRAPPTATPTPDATPTPETDTGIVPSAVPDAEASPTSEELTPTPEVVPTPTSATP
jgi:YbbR domain-containing protein